MKTRILHLIGSFHYGGSERQAMQLVRLLKSDPRFEIFVATLDSTGPLKAEVEAFSDNEVLEFRLRSFYGPGFLRQLFRCVKYLRKTKIKIIHTHDFYTNVFGIIAGRLAGVDSLIASKRETDGMRTANQKRVEMIIFRIANRIAANSMAVKAHLMANRAYENKITVIYNGIDEARFEHRSKERRTIAFELGLPIYENIRFITMVANLRHAVKNYPMFLLAASRLTKEYDNAHFVIAGEGELREELESFAGKLGVEDRTHFLGRCERVPDLLSISFAGTLTSIAEGFSNSILEYMAAGLPVVATDVGGAKEVIENGVTGYLVDSNDDAALAARLSDLLVDPETAAKMGELGRQTVTERFSTTAQVAAFRELYASTLSVSHRLKRMENL